MAANSRVDKGSERLQSELEQVLRSKEFVRSPVMTQLLTYLVEQSISNPDNPPKAYHVAVDGLGRADDFDVQSDSYPRVQVGRLRKMLATHYAQIDVDQKMFIPMGQYGVTFNGAEANPSAKEETGVDQPSPGDTSGVGSGRFFWKQKPALYLLTLAGVIAIIYFLLPAAVKDSHDQDRLQFFSSQDNFQRPPVLYIGAATHDDGEAASETARKITTFLTDAFQPFHSIRVSSQNAVAEQRNGTRNAYWLNSELVGINDNWLVRLQLVALDRKEIVWSRQISTNGRQTDVAAKLGPIVSKIASIYGVIPDDQRTQLGSGELLGYSCVLRFEEYRRVRTTSMLKDVQECVDASLELEPLDPNILSAASFLEFLDSDLSQREGSVERGTQFASKALIRGKNNAYANFSVARAAFLAENCGRGENYANRALALNPLEHDVLLNAGAFMVGCENFEGEEHLQRAIALDPDGPTAQYTALIFLKMEQRKSSEALALAEKMVPPAGRTEPHYHLAMALVYAENGNEAKAKASWNHLQEQFGENPEDILSAIVTSKPLIRHGLRILSNNGII